MSHVAIVLGSVTPPGRLHRAVNAVAQRLTSLGHNADLIDLAVYRLDFADGRPAGDHEDDSSLVIDLVSAADAVILASPVYRGTFTGALKNLLDWLPVQALQAKPVGIVAMGATQHHHLGVDWQLRAVLAWFGALVAPTSVYLASEDFLDGILKEPAAKKLDELFDAALALTGTSLVSVGPAPLAESSSRS